MSEKSSKKSAATDTKSPVDRAGDLARQIWLAGIGAYGQAMDDTQQQVTRRVAKVSKDTTKIFDELVSRGNDLEQRLGELGTLGKLGAEAGAKKLRQSADMSLSLEDRLARMRDLLGLAPSGSGVELKLDQLQSGMVALAEKMDALIELQAGSTTPKKSATAKKAPAKKKPRVAKKKASSKK